MPNNRLHNNTLNPNARSLRKNETEEEKRLWYCCLREMPVKFKRQVTIGEYIVDFFCPSAKIVVELDGGQHYEDKGLRYDKKRDEYLRSQGLTVLRYTNYELERQFRAVCEDIYGHLGIEE